MNVSLPTDARLVELARLVIDKRAPEIGPLDRKDIEAALYELIGRRSVEAAATPSSQGGSKGVSPTQ